MSMKFRIFGPTGERRAQISLALRKSDVAQRLLTCLQSGDLAKAGKFNINSLVKIDSGEFSVHSLPALGYSADEIETAIQRRIEEISHETDELAGLQALLRDGSFAAAQGGERVVGREHAMIANWHETVTGARKSLSSANLSRDQKIAKSRAMGGTSCRDILTAHSWERTDGDKGTDIYTHGRIPGHSIHVNVKTEAWEHRKGAKVLGASERDDEQQVAAATLNAHLMQQFHR